MNIEVKQARELTDDHVKAWAAIQRANPELGNPSFAPEFTQAVATTRDDVEVAILSEGDRHVGFFPFQRERRNVGAPVGSLLTDMHGVIAAADLPWDPAELIRECGLAAWEFDHLIASQQPFESYIKCVEESPYMDLADGYETYIERRVAEKCSSIKRAPSKARKVEREIGPLRFVLSDTNPATFETVIRWKREQVADTCGTDIFRHEWVVETLRAACEINTPNFEGSVASLYAGDELLAALIGMRSGSVYSSWIPTLNPAYSKYSPGLLLHLELAKHAAAEGITRIDLGRGANQMKTSLRSAAIPLALGAVDRRPLNRFVRHCWYKTRDLVYAMPLGGVSLRFYRRVRSWSTLSS